MLAGCVPWDWWVWRPRKWLTRNGHLDSGSDDGPADLGEEPIDSEAPDLDTGAADDIDISSIEGQDLL